jgi:LPS-assembly protein
LLNLSYSLQRGVSEQINIGWQWPINDLWGDKGEDLGRGRGQGEGRWYSVGRLNYDKFNRQLVDAIIGFEYDAGCWLGRIVLDRTTSGTTTASTRIMFQLEFVGFARVGTNPLQTLKQNIPRYQFLREQVTTPSRFGNYD